MIRRATPDDAEALGRLHAACWAETYPGIAPPRMLARMSDAAARIAEWRALLAAPPAGAAVEVAIADGVPAGFVLALPAREPALGAAGEIASLYLLRAAHRRGFGRALMAAAARRLIASGMADAALWVIAGNTEARRFYAALAGEEGPAREIPVGEGEAFTEIRVRWGSLATLAWGRRSQTPGDARP